MSAIEIVEQIEHDFHEKLASKASSTNVPRKRFTGQKPRCQLCVQKSNFDTKTRKIFKETLENAFEKRFGNSFLTKPFRNRFWYQNL